MVTTTRIERIDRRREAKKCNKVYTIATSNAPTGTIHHHQSNSKVIDAVARRHVRGNHTTKQPRMYIETLTHTQKNMTYKPPTRRIVLSKCIDSGLIRALTKQKRILLRRYSRTYSKVYWETGTTDWTVKRTERMAPHKIELSSCAEFLQVVNCRSHITTKSNNNKRRHTIMNESMNE